MTKRTPIDPDALAGLIEIVDRGLGDLPPVDLTSDPSRARHRSAVAALCDRLRAEHGARCSVSGDQHRITMGGVTAGSVIGQVHAVWSWRTAARTAVRKALEDQA